MKYYFQGAVVDENASFGQNKNVTDLKIMNITEASPNYVSEVAGTLGLNIGMVSGEIPDYNFMDQLMKKEAIEKPIISFWVG